MKGLTVNRAIVRVMLAAAMALSMTSAAFARSETSFLNEFAYTGTTNLPLGMNLIDAGGGADRFVRLFNFAIADAWNLAGDDDVHMPSSPGESGYPLAQAILSAANTPQGEYRIEYLFGHILTPRVCAQVLTDLKHKYGAYDEILFLTMGNDFLNQLGAQVGVPGPA